MNDQRIAKIRELGDKLANYVKEENDRKFFHVFLTARRYDDVRAALIRAGVRLVKDQRPPLVDFDSFIQIFEEGEELPYSDWRLARDLVLIRMLEVLYQLGWLQAVAEELPEIEVATEEE